MLCIDDVLGLMFAADFPLGSIGGVDSVRIIGTSHEKDLYTTNTCYVQESVLVKHLANYFFCM
jgi:hypothetical protein